VRIAGRSRTPERRERSLERLRVAHPCS